VKTAVIVGEVFPPPLLQRRELGTSESTAIHRKGSKDTRRPAIAITKRMDCRNCNVNPARRQAGVWMPPLHLQAQLIDEIRNIPSGGRKKHLVTRHAIHDERGPLSAKSARPLAESSRKDSIVKSDYQLAIPSEGGIVGSAQDEVHRLSVAFDELSIFLTDLWWSVPRKDSANLFDGNRNALHGRRGCHCLRFEFPAEPASPQPRKRPPVVKDVLPAVELASQLAQLGGVVWE